MIRNSLAIIAFLLSNCLSFAEAEDNDTTSDQMNLIVIMTDEHNFRTLGCYRETLSKRQAYMWGKAVVETPNIDWIAKSGALCTSFYATTPVCSPSRAALISGKYPQATPVVTNNIPLNDDVVSFAELLKRKGYQTGFAGKWHLDGNAKPGWAPKRKFGFTDNRFMFNRGHWKNLVVTDKGPRVGARKNGRPSYDVAGADDKSFTTDFLMDRTIDFVNKNSDKPFCYMLSLPDPHGPDTVRAPYDTMYSKQTYEKPTTYDKATEGLPSWGAIKKSGYSMNKYYGMIRCIDDNVGRLLETLREQKLLEKTIVVFTADHGDLRGEHHRQNKGVPYEGSTRVPFLVHYPKIIKGGTIVNEALTSVDFAPTILSMMDVEHDSMHGRNFAPLFNMQNDSKSDWDDIAFVRGTGTKKGWLMAVTDRYKLVVSSDNRPWMFDLLRDPDEVVNVVDHSGYRETVTQMGKQLLNYCEKFDEPLIETAGVSHSIKWAVSGKGKFKHAK